MCVCVYAQVVFFLSHACMPTTDARIGQMCGLTCFELFLMLHILLTKMVGLT